MKQNPDGCFIGIGHQLLVFPLIAKGCCATDWLAHLGSDGNGGCHALDNLFTLPLRHGGDHGEKQATGRRTGINGFLEGYEVSAHISEYLGYVEKFAGVSSEPRQFRKDQAGNVTSLNIGQHPFGLGMANDGFAAHRLQPVGFGNVPAFSFRI